MIKIRGSQFYSNIVRGSGGAIYAEGANTVLTIEGSNFRGNSAGMAGCGGAISADVEVSLDLSAVSFVSNRAFAGGAVTCCGGSISNVTIEDSTTAEVENVSKREMIETAIVVAS